MAWCTLVVLVCSFQLPCCLQSLVFGDEVVLRLVVVQVFAVLVVVLKLSPLLVALQLSQPLVVLQLSLLLVVQSAGVD